MNIRHDLLDNAPDEIPSTSNGTKRKKK